MPHKHLAPQRWRCIADIIQVPRKWIIVLVRRRRRCGPFVSQVAWEGHVHAVYTAHGRWTVGHGLGKGIKPQVVFFRSRRHELKVVATHRNAEQVGQTDASLVAALELGLG